MIKNEFVHYLKTENNDLPGFEAQLKMAPKFKGVNFRSFKPKADAKSSAVLILVVGDNHNFDILFTLRSEKLRNHNGQISFPGGRSDINETPIDTALRETWEEVGIEKQHITIVTELTELYVPPSNSIIKPVVGYIDEQPNLIINPDEVEEAFFVKIDEFYNVENYKVTKRVLQEQEIETPEWIIHPKTPLWGATAIIMSEFIELHRKFKTNKK